MSSRRLIQTSSIPRTAETTMLEGTAKAQRSRPTSLTQKITSNNESSSTHEQFEDKPAPPRERTVERSSSTGQIRSRLRARLTIVVRTEGPTTETGGSASQEGSEGSPQSGAEVLPRSLRGGGREGEAKDALELMLAQKDGSGFHNTDRAPDRLLPAKGTRRGTMHPTRQSARIRKMREIGGDAGANQGVYAFIMRWYQAEEILIGRDQQWEDFMDTYMPDQQEAIQGGDHKHRTMHEIVAAAIREKLDSAGQSKLVNRKTWRMISKFDPKAQGQRPLPLKWVFTYKFTSEGETKCKARIVARGNLQQQQQHHTLQDTYAATLAARTLRTMLAFASS